MLLLVTGSSCSGKSTIARVIGGSLTNVVAHDSDEHGVPSNADTAWRQADLRQWVLQARELERRGVDLLLTGQSPIGELLAVPEADELDLAVCLVDVGDRTRAQRLEHRDPGQWSAEAKDRFNNWARWHRLHADDPAHLPDVITTNATAGMQWDRWRGWTRDEPRRAVTRIDTTGRTVSESAQALRTWVEHTRASCADDSLPLLRGWSS